MDGPVKKDMKQTKIRPEWASDRERELIQRDVKRQLYPRNDGKARKVKIYCNSYILLTGWTDNNREDMTKYELTADMTNTDST